jgi:hypothetical protein
MSLVTSTPVPSGSHTGSDTPSARLETRRASPPVPPTGNSHNCAPLSRVETKASVRPSGDQRGWRSEPGPAVSWRVVPPATSASQMRVVPRFSLSEEWVTV